MNHDPTFDGSALSSAEHPERLTEIVPVDDQRTLPVPAGADRVTTAIWRQCAGDRGAQRLVDALYHGYGHTLSSIDASEREKLPAISRLLRDPGIPDAERDGKDHLIVGWMASVRRGEAEDGEIVPYASLALRRGDGRVVRLSGRPACAGWADVRALMDGEELRAGVMIHCRRVKSRAGRSYHQIDWVRWATREDWTTHAPGVQDAGKKKGSKHGS